MGEQLVRVILPNVDGVASDGAVNDFAFASVSDHPTLAAHVWDFYNSTYGGHTVGSYLGPSISRVANVASIEVYDITAHLDGSPHGSPVYVSPVTVPAPSSVAQLPSQCAVVFSYHAGAPYAAALETGPTGEIPTDDAAVDEGAPVTHMGNSRPKSRLRGRIYVGPLTVNVPTTNEGEMAAGDPLPTVLKAAALALLGVEPNWGIWSRRNAAIAPIAGGWIDLQIGTQRRRRVKTTTKTAWAPV